MFVHKHVYRNYCNHVYKTACVYQLTLAFIALNCCLASLKEISIMYVCFEIDLV